ncbi:MAG: hypothetical protein GIW99_00510 [Candidatus Eremiobacteraeota bacterium]|nr:hypothetical protein [Candidatus Eremiobacteraeota bacterium]MBC5826168.1 hypothetical protein [Candidatus Eremiobacteraeota bacterium]
MEVFAYLSVLISIILGLGIAHLLGAFIRLIHNRSRTMLYWPSLAWAVNLFVLMVLVWWSDFGLTRHTHWTFTMFIVSLLLPALLYLCAGLILPSSDVHANDQMARSYEENRVWFFAFLSAAIWLSFVQSFLVDGYVKANVDTGLKLVSALLSMVPIAIRNEYVQKAVVLINLALLIFYISLLFSTLPSN